MNTNLPILGKTFNYINSDIVKILEATPRIELGYKDLQSSA